MNVILDPILDRYETIENDLYQLTTWALGDPGKYQATTKFDRL